VFAFANFVNGGVDVPFHPVELAFADVIERHIDLMNGFDAFAVFVVRGFFEMTFRLLEVLGVIWLVPGLFELLDGHIHLGLVGVKAVDAERQGKRGERGDQWGAEGMKFHDSMGFGLRRSQCEEFCSGSNREISWLL
jgi:hypothetical protein